MSNKTEDTTPQVAGDKKKLLLWIGIPVAIVLIATAFILGVYWASQQSDDTLDTVELTEFDSEMMDGESEKPAEEEEEEPKLDVSIGEQALMIDWLPLEQQNEVAVSAALDEALTEPYLEEEPDYLADRAYKLGTVNGGVYDGYTLTEEYYALEGMGTYMKTFYTLTDPEGLSPLIILDRYASTLAFTNTATNLRSAREVLDKAELEGLANEVRFDSGAVIAEFEASDTVLDTQGQEYVYYGVTMRVDELEDTNYLNWKPNATLENGRVLRLISINDEYSWLDGLFATLREDGRLAIYDLDILFFDQTSSTIEVPQVYWDEGGRNDNEYSRGMIVGCGMAKPINVVESGEVGTLEQTGYYYDNSVKEPIYEPVDYSVEYFETAFERWQIRTDKPEGTIEEFASNHPFFYYQDSLGRWMEFAHSDVMPLAECGKPVIYLYPEETTDIDVTLTPQGGFTVTEPVYDNGWRVTASPDGTLVNRDDGEEYPYLFWEGHGRAYTAPDRYWVVENNEVEKFLVETLHDLGLTTPEIVDFMDFWYPRMQDAPWYKIGFHGTEVMDLIAPMELSEEPDSIFRILMDYEELEEPIAENPPYIPEFEREGFSVIEWGGVIK